jgi:hypothetical protein
MTLGAAVDAAEYETDEAIFCGSDDIRATADQLGAARRDYFDALRQPWLAELERLEASEPGRQNRAKLDKLRKRMEYARRRLAVLNAAGSAFFTAREYLRAQADEEAAEGRFEFFYRRRMRALHDAPICFDVDGVKYVRTGFKKIAGERKEIWEKVMK